MEKEHLIAPASGDIIITNLNPIVGHEQGGKRPILVISEQRLNQKTHVVVCVPITSKQKEYATEVVISTNTTKGCVLCNHIKTLDWAARGYTKVDTISKSELETVKNVINIIINGSTTTPA